MLLYASNKGEDHLQGFFYSSEVGARGLLNLGKKAFEASIWENLIQYYKLLSKRTGFPF